MDPVVVWEIKLFLISGLFGIAIGVIFDGFRAMRRVKEHKNYAVSIEDLIFWLIVTCIVFYVLYHFLQGQFRAFVLYGMGLGLILYYNFLSFLILWLLEWIVLVISTIISVVFSILLYPFRLICGKIILLLKKIAKSITIIGTNK